jgi:hypothetical protein
LSGCAAYGSGHEDKQHWLAADKLSWFGSLPGDIKIERPGFRFYAPIATMLLLSVGLSLLFWLFGKFFR